jgi:aspartyl protease family protein
MMNAAPLSFLLGSLATFALGYSAALPAEGEIVAPGSARANQMIIGSKNRPLANPSQTDRVFRRAADGLFYVTARVNGTNVRFLVDSGATVVVLSEVDAARAGIEAKDMRPGPRLQTASGSTAMRWSRVKSMQVGDTILNGVDSAVVGSGLTTSLLGQNALTKLGNVTINGDTLKIG